MKGKKIYLHFEAVDEDCKLYVNGKFAGSHPYVKPDDWKTPFAIRIDPFIDWEKPLITVVVRVFDGSGGGGIWKPIWITAE